MRHFIFLLLIISNSNAYTQTIPDKYSKFYQEVEATTFKKKIKMIDKAIKKNPNEPWFYWMKASSYELFDQSKVVENYEKALSIDSNFSGGHASLARYYFYNDSAKLEAALSHINKAIVLEPSEHYYHIDRGNIFLALKQYDLAEAEAKYVLTLPEVDYLPPCQLLVETLYACGKRTELNEFILKYDLSQFGGFMDTNFDVLLGNLYEELGEHDKACACFQAAAQPYSWMDGEIPADLVLKLKSCN
jgi:tetratricopeptide (TPR) repeat protein